MGATLESRCWGDGPEGRVRTGVDWEEEEDRAWADWCLGVLWGGALLGRATAESAGRGEGGRQSLGVVRSIKVQGISASLPPLRPTAQPFRG